MSVHVFGAREEPSELDPPVYCTDSSAPEAVTVFHSQVLQCSGEWNWVCLDCGLTTLSKAQA